MTDRPSWDDYFLNMLPAIGARSTCDRGRCGAIITLNNIILSTGYAGAPRGLPHCDDVGHQFEYVLEDTAIVAHCIRTSHAEVNAIYTGARNSIGLEGATLYSTMFPCPKCAMAIIQVGIESVIALNEYQSSRESKDMFEKVGIYFRIEHQRNLY